MTTFAQPEDNEFASEVFQELMALSASFRERCFFSIADELENLACRGPEKMQIAINAEVLRQCLGVELAIENLRAAFK
jgi:hypothetical protein